MDEKESQSTLKVLDYDEKLYRCWVVVEDCREFLPLPDAVKVCAETHAEKDSCEKSSEQYKDEFGALLSVLSQVTISRSRDNSVKAVCGSKMPRNKMYSKKSHLYKIKKPQSHKKRGPSENGFSASAVSAKRHLLKKYGSSLLRKSSFSVDGRDAGLSSSVVENSTDRKEGFSNAGDDLTVSQEARSSNGPISINEKSGKLVSSEQTPKSPTRACEELDSAPATQRFCAVFGDDKVNSAKSSEADNDVSMEGSATSKDTLAAARQHLREKYTLQHVSSASKPGRKVRAIGTRNSTCDTDSNVIFTSSSETVTRSNKPADVVVLTDDESKQRKIIPNEKNLFFTNPSHPMPPVGLIVNVGIGLPVVSLQAQCVLTCLDECRKSISPQFAEFCTSVIKKTPETLTKTVVLPIEDKRIREFMKIKWNSKSVVRKVSESSLSTLKIGRPQKPCVAKQSKMDVQGSKRTAANSPSNGPQVKHVAQCDSSVENGLTNTKCCSPQKSKSTTLKKTEAVKEDNQHQKYIDGHDRQSSSRLSKPDQEYVQHEESDEVPRKRAKLTLLAADKGKQISTENQMSTEVKLSESGTTLNINKGDSKALAAKHCNNGQNPPQDPEPPYDPDDIRGVQGTEEFPDKPSKVPRNRTSHQFHELRRLNVAVFDMPKSVEPVVCKAPEFCRLGCVCISLSAHIVRDHCGLEECMFKCTCTKPQASRQENSGQSYTWVHNKTNANLAKVERQFKQTVVRSSNDDLILVETKRKREIKMPERYRETSDENIDIQAKRQFGSKVPHKSYLQETGNANIGGNCVRPLGVSKGDLHDNLLKKENKGVLFSGANAELPEDLDSETCARIVTYHPKPKATSQRKQRKAMNKSTCDQLEANSAPNLADIKLVGPGRVGESIGEIISPDLPCSVLFNPSFVKAKEKEVVVLSWEALRRDIDNKSVYLWLKSVNSNYKIFLTNKFVKPSADCSELQSLSISSEEYKNLPFNLETLRSDYTLSNGEKKCKWIVKHQKWYWVIVGFMEPGRVNRQLCDAEEIDVLPSRIESSQHRWWVMDINQNFDLIYFLNFKKAITKDQIVTLLKLSNEYAEGETKFHRILLNRKRPNIDPGPTVYPDFGAYSLPDRPSEVLIGPYEPFGEPRFQVYVQKIAHNGKAQYEKIPLCFCGDGGYIRVNSNGVVSLHLEDTPEKCVIGTWYSSYQNGNSNNVSELKDGLKQVGKNNEATTPEFIDLTETEFSNCQNAGLTASQESIVCDVDSVDDVLEDVPQLLTRASKDTWKKNQVSSTSSCLTTTELKIASSRKNISDEIEDNDITGDDQELKMEYLIPSVIGIGVLPITHLPSGAISVTHFTESGLLKFFHSKEKLIAEINKLIHQRLACMSRKCSIYLKSSEVCKCVSWESSSERDRVRHLPQFCPDLFNGFIMLTKYGLVDIRTAGKHSIQKIGQDWIEWLRNDEFRLRLVKWQQKEKQGLATEHHGVSEVLTEKQASNLSLLQVLNMATQEIAVQKAQDQLLDHESRAQKLMKETLIHSLCRKLNGIPGTIVPQFMEQLDLDVLWEVLECMDSRNTQLLPTDRPISPITTHARGYSSPLISILREERKYDSTHIQKQHTALQQQQLRMQMQQPDEDLVNKILAHHHPSLPVLHQEKKGHVYQFSPFSRLNICVDEAGVMDTPSSLTMPNVQTSPGKPPNILRKRRSSSGELHVQADSATTGSITTGGPLHRRKQTFSCSTDNDDEPVYLDDSVLDNDDSQDAAGSAPQTLSTTANPQRPISLASDMSETDPISSLRISSVVSKVSVVHESVTPKPKSLWHLPSAPSDPISSLRISSVLSGASALQLCTSDSSTPTQANAKLISSLQGIKCIVPKTTSQGVSSSTISSSPSVASVNVVLTSAKSPEKTFRQRVFVKPSIALTSQKDRIPASGNAGGNSLESIISVASPIANQIRPAVPNFNTKPCYVITSKDGKVIRTEVPSKQLTCAQSAAQTRTIRVIQKGNRGYSLTVPLSSIKVLPQSALSKLPGHSLLAGKAVVSNSGSNQKGITTMAPMGVGTSQVSSKHFTLPMSVLGFDGEPGER